MAITFINRVATTSPQPATFSLGAITHSAGDLLVVGVQQQSSTPPVVTNTASDLWTTTPNSPQNNNGGANYEFLFWTITSGHASDVVQVVAASGVYTTGVCYSFHTSGTWNSPAFLNDSGGQGATTNITTGNISFSAPAVVIVAMLECDGQPFTAGAGYAAAISDFIGFVNDEYHIVGSSEAATGSQASGMNYGIIAAAFGESGGGGGSRGLFQPSPLSGLGGGGSGYFRDPLGMQII